MTEASAARPTEKRRGSALLAVSLAAVILAGIYRAVTLPLNHDVAWPLHLAGRMLAGDRLYVDLIEVNPPLVIWLGMPVVFLKNWIGADPTLTYPIIVSVLAGLSLWVTTAIARPFLSEHERLPFAAVVAVALFIVPGASFNQREHLMLILVLPYVFTTAARVSGIAAHRTWWTAIPAGIAFCIKPHFVIGFLAIEAWAALKKVGPWRGTWIIVGIGATYAVSVLAFAPDYLSMIWRLAEAYAGSSDISIPALLLKPRAFLPLVVLLLVALPGGQLAGLRRTLGVMLAAWLAMALLQRKDFYYPYHFFPAIGGALIAAGLGVIVISRARAHRLVFVGGMVVSLISVSWVLLRPGSMEGQWLRVEAFRSVAQGERALVLSDSQGQAWPAVMYADIDWTFGMPCTWGAGTTAYADSLTADFVTRALRDGPSAVLVTTNSADNPLPDLMRHAAFRSAWSEYVPVDTVLHYQVYRPRASVPGRPVPSRQPAVSPDVPGRPAPLRQPAVSPDVPGRPVPSRRPAIGPDVPGATFAR